MNWIEEHMNSIILGNSYELIKKIPDNSIDLIITDPPYEIRKTDGGSNNELAKNIKKMNSMLKDNDLTCSIDEKIFPEFIRIMKEVNLYIWCNHLQLPMYLDYFVTKMKCRFDIIIWNKTNPTPLFCNKYMTDKEYCIYFRKNGYCNPIDYDHAKTVYFQPINISDKMNFKHPTIKPHIVRNLMENSSKEGQLIFDPFSGSGTVCVTAKELKRNFIGVELIKKWHEISIDRLNGINANGQTSIFTDFEDT